MWSRRLALITLAWASVMIVPPSASGAEFFVAPNGNDGAPGTSTSPWQT